MCISRHTEAHTCVLALTLTWKDKIGQTGLSLHQIAGTAIAGLNEGLLALGSLNKPLPLLTSTVSYCLYTRDLLERLYKPVEIVAMKLKAASTLSNMPWKSRLIYFATEKQTTCSSNFEWGSC